MDRGEINSSVPLHHPASQAAPDSAENLRPEALTRVQAEKNLFLPSFIRLFILKLSEEETKWVLETKTKICFLSEELEGWIGNRERGQDRTRRMMKSLNGNK